MQGRTTTTFVLVHGSWHGGWCWRKLAPILRQAGHDVYTPTFTGMGDRAHLLDVRATLDTHIRDIVALLDCEDLHDAVLVGHSYGGQVISGVAESSSTRIARLVYLDAFIPRDGDSLFSMRPPSFEEWFRARAEAEGEGWLIPALPPEDYGVLDPVDIAWMLPRLTPVLLSTFADPASLPTGAAEHLPRSYLFCTEYGFGAEARRARSEGWDYHELHSSHDPMVTMPEVLAGVLLAAATAE